MADSVNLNSFPGSSSEALAFLYVQHQDLTGMTPEDINTMYQEAYHAIHQDNKRKRETLWFSDLKD